MHVRAGQNAKTSAVVEKSQAKDEMLAMVKWGRILANRQRNVCNRYVVSAEIESQDEILSSSFVESTTVDSGRGDDLPVKHAISFNYYK